MIVLRLISVAIMPPTQINAKQRKLRTTTKTRSQRERHRAKRINTQTLRVSHRSKSRKNALDAGTTDYSSASQRHKRQASYIRRDNMTRKKKQSKLRRENRLICRQKLSCLTPCTQAE